MIPQKEREKHRLQQEPPSASLLQRNPNNDNAGRVKVTFYTDPLCCWSWAFQEVWQRFTADYANDISYSYVLAGMIPDWNTYKDDMNSVATPLQMGPVWMHASQVTHVPMKYSIWHEDPPASSFPPCIAIKTAGLQSAGAEETFLHEARKALMLEGKNISKVSVLAEIAKTLDGAAFSFGTFKRDWNAGKGKDAFKSDMKKAKLHNIGRYPTLTFQNERGDGMMMVGYRPYEALVEAFDRFRTDN